jgi:hypothetical protein
MLPFFDSVVDDYDVYGKPMALRAKGKRASSGDEAGSGMPPASLFTSARGTPPSHTPLYDEKTLVSSSPSDVC